MRSACSSRPARQTAPPRRPWPCAPSAAHLCAVPAPANARKSARPDCAPRAPDPGRTSAGANGRSGFHRPRRNTADSGYAAAHRRRWRTRCPARNRCASPASGFAAPAPCAQRWPHRGSYRPGRNRCRIARCARRSDPALPATCPRRSAHHPGPTAAQTAPGRWPSRRWPGRHCARRRRCTPDLPPAAPPCSRAAPTRWRWTGRQSPPRPPARRRAPRLATVPTPGRAGHWLRSRFSGLAGCRNRAKSQTTYAVSRFRPKPGSSGRTAPAVRGGLPAGRRRTPGRSATAPSTGAEDTGTPAQGGPCDARRARKRSWVRLWVWVYADTPGCMVFFHSETAKLPHPGPGARAHSRSQHGAGPCPLPGAPTCGRLEKTYTRGLFDPLAGRFALRLCLQNRGETLIRQSRRCHFGADKIVGWQMNLIQTLEAEEIARLNKTIPDFSAGDTVIVNVNVVEGSRKRVQAYEGVVIAKRNRGLNSGFIVRKISSGEGVERTFQTYTPLIASIEVRRRGDVGRAKLYYLRERSGKSARIKEKLPARTKAAPASAA